MTTTTTYCGGVRRPWHLVAGGRWTDAFAPHVVPFRREPIAADRDCGHGRCVPFFYDVEIPWRKDPINFLSSVAPFRAPQPESTTFACKKRNCCCRRGAASSSSSSSASPVCCRAKGRRGYVARCHHGPPEPFEGTGRETYHTFTAPGELQADAERRRMQTGSATRATPPQRHESRATPVVPLVSSQPRLDRPVIPASAQLQHPSRLFRSRDPDPYSWVRTKIVIEPPNGMNGLSTF